MLKKIVKSWVKENFVISILIILSFVLGIFTYSIITKEAFLNTPDPSKVITVVMLDLVVLLGLVILLGRKMIAYRYNVGVKGGLYKKISWMCFIAGFVPTVLVAIFSIYFFNFGIQSWFDKRITNVLDQSLYVAQGYIQDQDLRMKQIASSMADDFSTLYYKITEKPELFQEVLDAHSDLYTLNEAIVFNRSTRNIIAQSILSFAFTLMNIPDSDLDKAANGEIVKLEGSKNKIQYLVRLPAFNDAYLLVGRMIDQDILNYIDKTHGALANYNNLKGDIYHLQIRFSIIFILVATLLLMASFYSGLLLADQFVKPINELVDATDKVKKGDFTIQVDETEGRTEIDILVSAFNMMVKRIDYQQKDLLLAQRALAWSEVARRVAHEIKNPLTSIFLSVDRLSKRFTKQVEDQEGFSKYIENILRFSGNINTILSEFVNFARLPEPVFKNFELVSFLKSLIESRQIISESISYEFDTDITKLPFYGDQDQLNQVFVNLFKNSEESILENKKQEKWIRVKLYKEDGLLICCVEDSGVGFSADLIVKVTEAYFTTRVKGTGLGLAIVKKIIQDHKGSIIIDNNEYGGGKVVITFELAKLNESKSV